MISYYINNFIHFSLGFGIGFILNNFIKEQYPNEYIIYKNLMTNLFFNVSYNCIYFYSKCQIFLFKIKKFIYSTINSNTIIKSIIDDINQLKFYFYNLDLENYNIDYYIDYCDGYDFYIHNYPVNNTVNRHICFSDNNNLINENSDIKFMLVEFKIGEKKFKIDLKTNIFNYYLVNNKFTKEFFIYYIKKHINTDETINNSDKCLLQIIDHNVNNIELEFVNKDDSILLEKSDYKIIKN
jgi:hypothetical protein